MKIQFIKETKANGEQMYYTKVDDSYISSTLSYNVDEAKAIYDNVVKNNGKYITTEVLESVEIDAVSASAVF
jgi:hypothetical protein